MILFLDFDGVLHPTFEPSDRDGYWVPFRGSKFVSAPVLVEILRPYRDRIDIVISSTWGATRSLDELKALLPAEVSELVVDAVHQRLPSLVDFTRGGDINSRYAEIAYYQRTVCPDHSGHWLALDDDDDGWPIEQRHHLVHAERDLGEIVTQHRLRDALALQLMPRTTDS